MGLDITIERPSDYERHPEWDDRRYRDDRNFWQIFPQALFECKEAEGFPWEDDRVWYRPIDFAAFREAAKSASSPERWLHAAALLEDNPDFWLYFSY